MCGIQNNKKKFINTILKIMKNTTPQYLAALISSANGSTTFNLNYGRLVPNILEFLSEFFSKISYICFNLCMLITFIITFNVIIITFMLNWIILWYL